MLFCCPLSSATKPLSIESAVSTTTLRMRATLLVVVAYAAALAALCAAGSLEHAEMLLPSEAEERSECCAARVTDLLAHLAELDAENIVLRKANERLTGEVDENVKVNERLTGELNEYVKVTSDWRASAMSVPWQDGALTFNATKTS